MNCQEYPGPLTAGAVNESAMCTELPSAAPLLNWMHVIHEPDHDSEELYSEEAWRDAPDTSALCRS